MFRPIFALVLLCVQGGATDSFRFAILGDRTGEAEAGVYEQIWKEVAAENPVLVVSVGDSIQGDLPEAEWREFRGIVDPFRRIPLYLAAGNHDVSFAQYSGRPLHYSFNYRQAHFTILDNSRTENLTAAELSFLEADLKANAAQSLKIVVFHRPSWLLNVALRNPDFALHQLAKRYGVRYVISGHLHQMLHFELEGVTYVSMCSSGGHLRLTKAYSDGWFLGHGLVGVKDKTVDFRIEESAPRSRVSRVTDWGPAGLVKK